MWYYLHCRISTMLCIRNRITTIFIMLLIWSLNSFCSIQWVGQRRPGTFQHWRRRWFKATLWRIMSWWRTSTVMDRPISRSRVMVRTCRDWVCLSCGTWGLRWAGDVWTKLITPVVATNNVASASFLTFAWLREKLSHGVLSIMKARASWSGPLLRFVDSD